MAPIHHACGRGDLDEVMKTLNNDPYQINMVGYFGWTPIFWAVRGRWQDVIDELITRGANLSIVDKDGKTVMDYACNVRLSLDHVC